MVRISKADITDADFVDADELKSAADGAAIYKAGVTVTGVVSGTKTVTISGDILDDYDAPLEEGDTVIIAGNAAAGTYKVASIPSEFTFVVVESIPNAGAGTVSFRYPSGSSRVGFDPTGLTNTAAKTVQLAIKDLDAAMTGGGITEFQHEALDRLTHQINETSYDQYLYTGTRCDAIVTWTSPAMTLKIREEQFTYVGNKVTQIVTIQYDGAGVEKERNTEVLAYTGNRLDSDTRTHI